MALPNRDEHQHRSPREAPTVGRPRGALWRSLQADGVVWEGQVLLVGGDVDLAARMIVTHRRVVFVRGGEIALEIPRGWLRQEPVLRRDGVLEIAVATPESNPFDEPMRIPLRMREGHPAAGHIIAMLAPGGARRITPDTLSGIERAKEATASSSYDNFWAGLDDAPAPRPALAALPPLSPERGPETRPANERASATAHPAASSGRSGKEPLLRTSREAAAADNHLIGPIEPQEKLIRVSSNNPARPTAGPVAAFPIGGIAPRDQRQNPWALFLRLAALTILLAAAAALGAGRLNIHLPLPGANSGASGVLTAPTEPAADAPASNADTTAPAATQETPAAAALTPDQMTAVAVGVGAGDEAEAPAATDQAVAIPTPSASDAANVAGAPDAAVPDASDAANAPADTGAANVDNAAAAPDASGATANAETAAAPEATAPNSAAPNAPAGPAAATTAEAAPQQPAADPAPAPQELIAGPVRLSIDTALRDTSLPKYGLPPGSGQWVLLRAELTNTGATAATVPMADFRLQDRVTGETATLDGGTSVIAGLAGLKPAYGDSDTITLDPGATADVLLLYLLPTEATRDDLALLYGGEALNLTTGE